MGPSRGLHLLAVLLLATSGSANSQQSLSVSSASAATTRGAITIDVVVTPKSGQPDAELRREDFTLLDNNVPVAIDSFRPLSAAQAPAEVTIVVDAVNTSYTTVAYERDQIKKFLRANGGQLALPTTLAILTDKGLQVQSAAIRDGNALSTELDNNQTGLRQINRSSGFYGAAERFDISLRGLHTLIQADAGRPGRKLVLWMSPGWPLLSGPGVRISSHEQQQIYSTIVDLSGELRRADVTLYSIDPLGVDESLGRVNYYQAFTKGISKPGQTDEADLSLQVLAVQSGGLALNSTGVAASLKQCYADPQAYYELTFNPARRQRPDDKPTGSAETYHHLQVKLAHPGLYARTRDGYYSQP